MNNIKSDQILVTLYLTWLLFAVYKFFVIQYPNSTKITQYKSNKIIFYISLYRH